MRKLIPFLARSIWALSLIVISGTYAFGQVFTVEQDQFSANHSYAIYFDMVDATDGYTSETGLSPTCTILYPSKTSYVSCLDTVTEIGTGTYRVRLSNGIEWENLGFGSLYITGAGSRPARIKYKVVENGSYFANGASLVKAPSDLNNTQQWTLSQATATSNSSTDYRSLTIADTLTGDGSSNLHRAAITNLLSSGGSRDYYGTVEVKSGSLNNAWVGDDNWGVGIDINTSTGAISTTSTGYLRGWKVEALPNSWWRIHWRYSVPPTLSTAIRMTLALGNGTVGTAPQVFVTSGTMLFARAYLLPAEAVSPELLNELLPNLASASSSTSVTLNANETATNDVLVNRQICFLPSYVATAQTKAVKSCSCITAFNGTTKVATLSPALYTTLSSSFRYQVGDICLRDVLTAGSVTGSVGSVTATVDAQVVGMDADTVTASAIASNAITSSEFAQSAGDKVWNTAPQDGSASTALGYLDAIKKYVANKMTIVGSDYEIFKDDQTTSYATGTTNSAGRDPD